MKKTWKIGENSKGGIITVEINGNEINIIGKEWDSSQGYSRGSNQSNAKEFIRKTILSNDSDSERKMFFFLTDLTTAYYADNVIQWIKSKIQIN